MPIDAQRILQEIDLALAEWRTMRAKSQHDDCSDQPEHEAMMVTSRLASTIDRLAPPGSHHKRSLDQIMARRGHEYIYLSPLAGALSALRREYELGYLSSYTELVHADTFASFMDMANHLQQQGYKDAAAVIAGTVLEQHLRELCRKHGIATEADGKYRKAEALNADLVGQSAYSKLDQKNVTSWLGLRNDAAHGNYSSYTPQQVQLMIDAVQHFLTRHPA